MISPSRFPDINTKEDLKNLVEELRRRSDGRPIGIKIAAGKIERDLEYCVFAQPDFITIDGRGRGHRRQPPAGAGFHQRAPPCMPCTGPESIWIRSVLISPW